MLTRIRKLNIVPLRLTALVLLAVVIATLLAACATNDEEDPRNPEDPGPGNEGPSMTIVPVTLITTPPPNGTIQTLEVLANGNGWQQMEIDISGVEPFRSLAATGRNYRAFSASPDIATVVVEQGTGMATVTAVTKGNALITITAVEFGGGNADLYSFTVIAPNRAPRVDNPIPASMNATVGTAFSYPIPENTFLDADSDPLTYTASTRPNASWLVFDATSRTFNGTPDANSVGFIIVTIIAQDSGGLKAIQTTVLTVTPASSSNQAPVAEGTIPAVTLGVNDLPVTRDVTSYFSDPDSGILTYTASTSNAVVATASVSGNVVTVTPEAVGSATITVTAHDPGGQTVSQTIAVTVTSESKPDLIVSSFSPPSKVRAGETFTLNAVVQNFGTGTADATTLKYYRSTDSTITSSDTQVGTDVSVISLGYLVFDSYQDNNIRAPSSAGAYYYGACVDSVPGETNTNNNCSIAVSVEVDDGTPDLVISSRSASVSSLTVGGTFTLYATVRNQGTAEAVATTLRYYRSSNSTITPNDTEVGTDSVSSLQISKVSSESIDLTEPSTSGAYYYGACVDSVSGETDTNNNCSTGIRVTFTLPLSPDLVILSGSASVSVSSLTVREVFTLSATAFNRGTGTADRTTLRYYRSTNSTISSGDTQVGTDSVRALNYLETDSEQTSLTAPSSTGTYYYGACVDSVSGETSTTNNCSDGVRVTVSGGTPDLVISSRSVSDSTLTAGDSFTLYATVRNQGTGTADSTLLRYYRSTNSTISSSDTRVGATDSVSTLDYLETDNEQVSLTAPSSAGTYYYGACVVSVSGETNTNNNCSAGVRVEVGSSGTPDLVISSRSVSDSTLSLSESFTLYATVRNQGTRTADSTDLRYYRSTNSTISSGDTLVGTDYVTSLRASSTSSESISLNAPSSTGTYYYGACVDSVSGEPNTSNNCSAGIAVTVSGSSDLVISSRSVSDSTLSLNESFTLYATVRNQGTGTADSTELKYYRSTNSTISSFDTPVGTDYVTSLGGSRTSSESIRLNAPSSTGTYYYGACVDAVSGETSTSNNCSDGVRVTVSGPDLVISSFNIPSSVRQGLYYTIYATVRNQGTGTADSTELKYYLQHSTDSTRTQLGTDYVRYLDSGETSSESIRFRVPSGYLPGGTWYITACVDSVSGETNTGNNCNYHHN